jgi:hypothetical protein
MDERDEHHIQLIEAREDAAKSFEVPKQAFHFIFIPFAV